MRLQTSSAKKKKKKNYILNINLRSILLFTKEKIVDIGWNNSSLAFFLVAKIYL